MDTLANFGQTAKSLSRNPLGIIALFIVLIYGFAALVVGGSTQLLEAERFPLIWFMVTFPLIVLLTFGWLVSRHYEKLYAPADFNSDDAFLKALNAKDQRRPGLKDLDVTIESKIRAALNAERFESISGSKVSLQRDLDKVADTLTSEIRDSEFITIDAREFTKSDDQVFELPVSAFRSFGELTNEIYFAIEKHVKPFQYGHSWVIEDCKTGKTLKNARMIAGMGAGMPVGDQRGLAEVGIEPGMVFKITRPSRMY